MLQWGSKIKFWHFTSTSTFDSAEHTEKVAQHRIANIPLKSTLKANTAQTHGLKLSGWAMISERNILMHSNQAATRYPSLLQVRETLDRSRK